MRDLCCGGSGSGSGSGIVLEYVWRCQTSYRLKERQNERKKGKPQRTSGKIRRAKKHAQKALEKCNMCYGSENSLSFLKFSRLESIREQLHFLTLFPPADLFFVPQLKENPFMTSQVLHYNDLIRSNHRQCYHARCGVQEPCFFIFLSIFHSFILFSCTVNDDDSELLLIVLADTITIELEGESAHWGAT